MLSTFASFLVVQSLEQLDLIFASSAPELPELAKLAALALSGSIFDSV